MDLTLQHVVGNRASLLAELRRRQGIVRDYVRAADRRYATGLYLFGWPGTAKTHALRARLLRVFSEKMLRHDNPDHRRLRRLVEQAFSRHSAENLRGRIGALCESLLDNDWSLVAPAVEELLRFVSPVQMSEQRYVIRGLQFHGQSLRRGDCIVAWLGAANADPARFPAPEKLDLARSPNPHVSFGSGIHFCLGAQLARVEAQVGLERLFTRYPKLALAGADSELKYSGNMLIRALVALPVRMQ